MAYLAKGRRQDLLELAETLDISIPDNFKFLDIKDAILKSEGYDAEFTCECLNRIISDRKELELRAEREKENQRQFELQKFQITTNTSTTSDSNMPKSQIPILFLEWMTCYIKQKLTLSCLHSDLRAGYHQVKVHVEDQDKTAFMLAIMPLEQFYFKGEGSAEHPIEYASRLLQQQFPTEPSIPSTRATTTTANYVSSPGRRRIHRGDCNLP
ncbi:hypothetical protein TNCV_1787701 [Trichonephila clavipes]|nr:hypothetical protein TNCV_1787701 [Trichonephila clavipes]